MDGRKALPFQIDKTVKLSWAYLDAGHNAENAALYCASEGLALVPRATIDKKKLGSAMKLGPGQEIVLAQTVGYFLAH